MGPIRFQEGRVQYVSNQLSTRQRVALRAVCRTILPAPVSDLEEIALEQSAERAEQVIASLADSGGRAAALQAVEWSDREESPPWLGPITQRLEAAGASEIFALHTSPVRIKPRQDGWLDDFMTQSDRQSYRNCRMSYVSFHQMGPPQWGVTRTNQWWGKQVSLTR